MALGASDDSSVHETTLAEVWNGTAWNVTPILTPPGSTSFSLAGVSCSSATACTAVGEYINSSNKILMLVEVWNGSTWSIQKAPSQNSPNDFVLMDVSCSSAAACSAVGYHINSSGIQLTLAEAWNGTVWRIQPTPNPSRASFNELDGVSCPTATACTAFGTFTNVEGLQVTLAAVRVG
jgi:hypothetical protein